MKGQKINAYEKFLQVKELWKPVIVGELNNQYVKFVKAKGEFPWHIHNEEDELFFVIEGELTLRTEQEIFILSKDEFIVIPKGVAHSPFADNEVKIMLFEPKTTLNTGNINNGFTHSNLEKI